MKKLEVLQVLQARGAKIEGEVARWENAHSKYEFNPRNGGHLKVTPKQANEYIKDHGYYFAGKLGDVLRWA